MTYELNTGDTAANDFPYPFKTENTFLLLSASSLAIGAVASLFSARTYFHNGEDRFALVSVVLSTSLFSVAVKFLIQALSQIRFYVGRKFPAGLADEVPPNSFGLAGGALPVIETLRLSAIEFPEPQGPLHGVLYSLIKPLISSPPPIQAAAVQHVHGVVAMASTLLSMAASYFFSAGTAYEGIMSWVYLPMTGLSLLMPFMRSQTDDTHANNLDHSNRMLWQLIGLMTFAILAPVLIPRFLPAAILPPLWIAPLLLLATSMVASILFLLSLFSQLDEMPQTSVTCVQTTISMNCHPKQLWPKAKRDLQSNWVRGVPNRVYANVPPGMADVDSSHGGFQGYLLEETQPKCLIDMKFGDTKKTPVERHVRYLIALNAWGLVLSVITAAVAAWYAPHFANMTRIEISRVVLVTTALSVASVLAFRNGHLLWSRLCFVSRLIMLCVDGTFQAGEVRIGNQLSGNVQSRAMVTRVQDATLSMWATDIITVSYGKSSKRFISAMAPADDYVASTINALKQFALHQSSITAPTSKRDLEIAKSIGRMNVALADSFGKASSENQAANNSSSCAHILPA